MVSIAAKPIEVNASTLADRAMQALYEDEHSPEVPINCQMMVENARRLLSQVLDIDPDEARITDQQFTVEVDGLLFTAMLSSERRHGEVLNDWGLCLYYLCPKCQMSPRTSDPIRSWADLGRALRYAETDICYQRCGG